jgi:serine/threonine protein kinase
MPLIPGTSLQNGHYVIDALLEAAPNGDLYWGTHVAAGMPVFIQVFPLGKSSHHDLAQLMARLEGIAFSPQSPLPNPFQLFHGEGQTLCLAMSTSVGLPWSIGRNSRAALSPRCALAIMRQLAESLAWLKAQGLSGLDLSPNRVWLSQQLETVTLTGLPHTYLQNFAASDNAPDKSVQALGQLLFSFLTGHPVSMSQTEASPSIRGQLKQYCPNLSPVMITAIEQALQKPGPGQASLTVPQWLALLPDADTTARVVTPGQNLTRSPLQPPSIMSEVKSPPVSKSRSLLLPSLAATAILAAIAGGSLGAYWRLNAQSMPGAIQLDPKQSFPEQAGWSGDTPEATFDTPYVPASNAGIRRDRWYESPAPNVRDTLSTERARDDDNEFILDSSNDPTAPNPASTLESIAPTPPPLTESPSAPAPRGLPAESWEAPDNEPAGLEAIQVPEETAPPEASPTETAAPTEIFDSSSITVPKSAPVSETAAES